VDRPSPLGKRFPARCERKVPVSDQIPSHPATQPFNRADPADGGCLTAKSQVQLAVTDAGDGNGSDHADWAAARLTC
jgi:hypothetical protein